MSLLHFQGKHVHISTSAPSLPLLSAVCNVLSFLPFLRLYGLRRLSTHAFLLLSSMSLQDRHSGTLQRFPVELLTRITDFLKPSSALSFIYTCKRFYTECGISSADLLDDRSPAKDAAFVHKEKLRLLCMLWRDRPIAGKAVCSGCAKVHHNTSFTTDELIKSPKKRQCFGRIGRLWICPHKTLNFDDLKACQNRIPNKGVDGFNENRFCWYCRRAGGPSFCQERNHRVTIETHCHVMTGRPNIERADVLAALKQLEISICPHLRLCDQFVSSLYDRNCGQISGTVCARPYRCYNCLRRKRPSCDTEFFFYLFKGSCASPPRLVVATKRFFGFFQDVADPRWTSQLVRPQDVPLLETSWELCDARLMNEESKQRFQMASSPIGRLDNIRIPDLRGKTSVAAAAALKRPSDK